MDNFEQWLKNFGIRLRAERNKQGLTRPELAKLAHTEQNYIIQIERGERSPSLHMFMNLRAALGVSADSLLFEDPKAIHKEPNIVLDNFISFISRKSDEEVVALFDIVRRISRYQKLNPK